MPDVNVLVYAHREDSEHHQRHARWILDLVASRSPFALSELVLSGFLRVVTNRKIFVRPSTIEEGTSFIRALVERPTCRLVRPGERHFSIFLALCEETRASGGLMADAYHAALAIEHGCTWVTNDMDFARFPGLDWRATA